MQGAAPGGAVGSWEMALVLGFSQDLVRLRSTGHCERRSPFPGEKESNIFQRGICIHLAIVLEQSFLSLSFKLLSVPAKEDPVLAPPGSLCVLAPITQDARTTDVSNAP